VHGALNEYYLCVESDQMNRKIRGLSGICEVSDVVVGSGIVSTCGTVSLGAIVVITGAIKGAVRDS